MGSGGWGGTPRWIEPTPLRREPKPSAPKPAPEPETPKDPTPTEDLLARTYAGLRLEIAELEVLMAGGEGLSERDLKRLDKGVVLMKVGAKLVKRVLRTHGARGRLKAREPA